MHDLSSADPPRGRKRGLRSLLQPQHPSLSGVSKTSRCADRPTPVRRGSQSSGRRAIPSRHFYDRLPSGRKNVAGTAIISGFPMPRGLRKRIGLTPLRPPSSTAAIRSTISSGRSPRVWPKRRGFPSSIGISAKAGPKGSGFRRRSGCTGSLTAAASTAKRSGTAVTSGRKKAAILHPRDRDSNSITSVREESDDGCVVSNTVRSHKSSFQRWQR